MQYLLQNKWKLYLSLPQLNSNILNDTNYKSKCHLTNLKIFLNQSEFSQDHVEDLSPPLRFNLSPLLRFPPWICPNIQVFPRFRRMRGYHKTIKIVVKSEVKKHGFSFQKLGITKKLSPLNKQKIKFKFSWTHKKNATDLFLPIVVLSIFHLMKGSLKSEDTVAVKTMSKTSAFLTTIQTCYDDLSMIILTWKSFVFTLRMVSMQIYYFFNSTETN